MGHKGVLEDPAGVWEYLTLVNKSWRDILDYEPFRLVASVDQLSEKFVDELLRSDCSPFV